MKKHDYHTEAQMALPDGVGTDIHEVVPRASRTNESSSQKALAGNQQVLR